ICGCESRDRSAAYAVPPFACDASTTLIDPGGRPGGVTLVHVLPASRVTWMNPVLVPTQTVPAAADDGASVVIDPPCAGDPTPPPPAVAASGSATPGGAARSLLIRRHVNPRSVDTSTCWAPNVERFGILRRKRERRRAAETILRRGLIQDDDLPRRAIEAAQDVIPALRVHVALVDRIGDQEPVLESAGGIPVVRTDFAEVGAARDARRAGILLRTADVIGKIV